MISSWKHIKKLPVIDYSGYDPKPGRIITAKKHQYYIVKNTAITGDAPKDIIRYYHYGISRKASYKKWPLYIAKLGHKRYPVESITEYLLSRIGECFGFNMAESELACFGGQIRFLSKYFIKNPRNQVLEHGADLYSGYLNDRGFIEEIERQHQSPIFFTVQFTLDTLKHLFPNNYKEIFIEFTNLILFDALIGNNDRHFYNWAIIRSITGDHEPVFSPVYDTARGLFWNDSEEKILKI